MKCKVKVLVLLLCLSLFASAKEINLVQAAQDAGMTLYWDSLALSGVLEKNGHCISFRAGDSFALQDYSKIMKEDAPYIKDNALTVSQSFFSSADQFFQNQEETNQYKIGVILIDPGHGGKDPGASAVHTINGKKRTVVEKDICLNVSLKLYDYLRKAYPDKRILLTRSTDEYLSLAQRTEMANSVKLAANEAILYVSVHVNASLDKNASGYEVWYLSPGYRRKVLTQDVSGDKNVNSIINNMMEEEYTTESVLIAKFITDGIKAQVTPLSESRGIKAEEWFVVRNSNMPAVLIETGFLTNPAEAALLIDENYLKKMSFGIYNGLQAFVTHFERSRGFTVIK